MTDAPGPSGRNSTGAPLDALVDEITSLRQRLVALEAERDAIGQRLANVEAENRSWVEQYVSSEQQRSDLSHLYAAIRTLSAPTSRDEVIDAIRQVVTNLIGAEDMALFETSVEGSTLSLVAAFGETTPPRRVRFGEGVIGQAALRGHCHVASGPEVQPVPGEPAVTACIPFKARGKVVGALALFRLLPQKAGLVPLDEKLFDVLSIHGGITWDAIAGPTGTEAQGAG